MNRVLLLCAATLAPALACAQDDAKPKDVKPNASHAVTTVRRSLSTLPAKGLITDDAGWKHVTTGLEGAPPKPGSEASPGGPRSRTSTWDRSLVTA